jgi:hypothetical protein
MADEQMLVTKVDETGLTITVTRGYNNTTADVVLFGTTIYIAAGSTPELSALILLFDKVPRVRTAWTIRIDTSRTVERAFVIEHEEPATTEGIWQFLKSLVNTPRLIKLEIPSLESGGVNVRITDFPGTFSEFRSAAGGRGFVELQLIETAGP